MEALAKVPKIERFDLMALNGALLVLKYGAIKDGIVLKDDRFRRVTFETAVLRNCLDTVHFREVQCRYLLEQIER